MIIIRTNIKDIENNKKKVYKLTKSSGQNVKDVEGTYAVDEWAIYTEENAKGETNTVLAILGYDVSGVPVKLQTISSTFIRDFCEVCDLMGEEDFAIDIIHGKSKSGRDFVSCELNCD